MRRFFLVLLMAFSLSMAAQAQMKWNERYQKYISQYKDIAVQEMHRYNIPASITLAQAIFESGAGASELAVKGNNHFGIKCHGWTGRKVYHDDDESQECFRAYDNPAQSFEDHSIFLSSSKRYSALFQLKRTDYKGWAQGLKDCGYATNPLYAQKLIQLIELYRLYEYDGETVSQSTIINKPPRQTAAHVIKIGNKNLYLIAHEGDSFKEIANEIGIAKRRLAKYNERNVKDILHEGDIVYLKKKQRKADKAYKNKPHIVRPGESMYSISQQYGVRLKSLYNKNKLSPDYQLRVGDRIRVY